ncbi:MAG: FAD-dependent oxidoreductase, partial [Candidatus Firestonebacteria bacterium]
MEQVFQMIKKTAVIGAGLAGLSAAYHLKKAGIETWLFEKAGHPGGLSASSVKNGFIFDFTGHFFHFKEDYAKEFVFGLPGCPLKSIKRNAGILINGQIIDYPFQANFSQMKDKAAVKECEEGLKNRKERENYGSFKDWILGTYGEGIARRFMFPYNSKLWAYDLDCILPAGTSSYIPDTKKKQSSYGYNSGFFYPETGGIGKIAEALAAESGKIEYLSEVEKIYAATKSLIVRGNLIVPYERLVSTVPLPELIKMTADAPLNVRKAAEALKYTSVFALNLGIERSSISDRHWIYVPEEKYLFYRVGFYSNVSAALCPAGTSSLYIE